MKIDIERVTKLVPEMVKDIKEGKGYDTKYDYLKEAIPSIYDIIVEDPDAALPNLMYMLKMAKDIEDGKASERKQSEKVGLFFAEKYVYSQIDMTKETKPDLK